MPREQPNAATVGLAKAARAVGASLDTPVSMVLDVHVHEPVRTDAASIGAGTQPVAALAEGVYFDASRRVALVFHATPARVEAVLISDGGVIDVEQFRPSVFTRRFIGRWTGYPMRRGARILLQSHLSKSDAAVKRLRVLSVM